VRRIAVATFAALEGDAPALDPDVAAAAEYVAGELARLLAESGALEVVAVPEARPSAAELCEVARAARAELVVGGSVRFAGDDMRVTALLVDSSQATRAVREEVLPLAQATALPRLLARAVLLALGEDASLPAGETLQDLPREAFLELVRARPSSGKPDCERLLDLIEKLPEFDAPLRALLDAADEARDTERMPELLAALERLRELRPADAEVLLALGGYRALHLDQEGARAAWLEAREAAQVPEHAASALGWLARLAAQAGRREEALAHLRAAARLVDDPEHHRLLGELLLPQDPAAAALALSRASVLAPRDASIRLQLSRALQQSGSPARAATAAAEALRLTRDPDLRAQAAAILEQLTQG